MPRTDVKRALRSNFRQMPSGVLCQFDKGSTALRVASRTAVRERNHQVQAARIEHIGGTWRTQREVERAPGERLIRLVAREGLRLCDLTLGVAHGEPLGAADKRARCVDSTASITLQKDAGGGGFSDKRARLKPRQRFVIEQRYPFLQERGLDIAHGEIRNTARAAARRALHVFATSRTNALVERICLRNKGAMGLWNSHRALVHPTFSRCRSRFGNWHSRALGPKHVLVIRRIAATHQTITLLSRTQVTPSVHHLVFQTPTPFDYLAGQWVKLTLRNGLTRDYSIASAPSEAMDRFELLVTHVEGGEGSRILCSLNPGARIEMLGPNGLFVREERHAHLPAVFIATGTGLAPLRAMIQEGARKLSPMRLLFGCRTEREILCGEEFSRLSRSSDFQHRVTLSRPDPAWTGERGYVQTHLQDIAAGLEDAHFYICGLRKMVDAVRSTLKEQLGVDRARIHSERYDD